MTFSAKISFQKSYDLLTLFSLSVAIYGFLQFHYVTHTPPDMNFPLLIVSLLLLLFPERPVFLLLFAGFGAAQYLSVLSVTSNHMMLAFLLWVYVIVAALFCFVRERSINIEPERFYKIFAPPGRLLLLTMYFFGVFHKLNFGFLNPDVSCASMVVDSLIFVPHGHVLPHFVYLMASYGTLAGEALIALMLIFPRTRYYAVVAGILFHMLISFSAFRYYVPFTMISIAMHVLFLDAAILQRLRAGVLGKFTMIGSSVIGRLVLAAPVLLAFMLFHFVFDYGALLQALLVWGVVGGVITLAVLVYDRPVVTMLAEKNYFISSLKILNLLPVLFFLSCFSPYFGFKTGQTINMFANLETEQGRSNHYIFRSPLPYLFDYQNDLVEILETDDPTLKNLEGRPLAITGYAFESTLLDNSGAYVKFRRHGAIQEIHGLTEEQKKAFHKPYLARKFMVFNVVNTSQPRQCLDIVDFDRLPGQPENR